MNLTMKAVKLILSFVSLVLSLVLISSNRLAGSVAGHPVEGWVLTVCLLILAGLTFYSGYITFDTGQPSKFKLILFSLLSTSLTFNTLFYLYHALRSASDQEYYISFGLIVLHAIPTVDYLRQVQQQIFDSWLTSVPVGYELDPVKVAQVRSEFFKFDLNSVNSVREYRGWANQFLSKADLYRPLSKMEPVLMWYQSGWAVAGGVVLLGLGSIGVYFLVSHLLNQSERTVDLAAQKIVDSLPVAQDLEKEITQQASTKVAGVFIQKMDGPLLRHLANQTAKEISTSEKGLKKVSHLVADCLLVEKSESITEFAKQRVTNVTAAHSQKLISLMNSNLIQEQVTLTVDKGFKNYTQQVCQNLTHKAGQLPLQNPTGQTLKELSKSISELFPS